MCAGDGGSVGGEWMLLLPLLRWLAYALSSYLKFIYRRFPSALKCVFHPEPCLLTEGTVPYLPSRLFRAALTMNTSGGPWGLFQRQMKTKMVQLQHPQQQPLCPRREMEAADEGGPSQTLPLPPKQVTWTLTTPRWGVLPSGH